SGRPEHGRRVVQYTMRRLVFLLLAASSTEAWALCSAPPEGMKAKASISSAVFTCTVLREGKLGHKLVARVRVLQSWKGVQPGSTILLWGGGVDRAWVEDTNIFGRNEQWLIFANREKGVWLAGG